jgi:hypothetical protein
MARANRPYGGVYENMDFGTYAYQEYPKHIKTGDHGKYEVALNAEEEATIRARLDFKKEVITAKQEALGPDIEKEKLILRCEDLDIPINRKWSVEKLHMLIRQAESSIDALPAEPASIEKVEGRNGPRHKELLEEAKTLGINVNHLWGIPRLEAAIAKAKEE